MGNWNGQSHSGFGNRQRKHGQAVRRKRKTWDQIKRQKQGPTLYWRAYKATHGEFNKSPYVKAIALVFVALTVSGGLYLWSQQPGNGLFHHYAAKPCSNGHNLPGGCADPYTTIWQTTAPNSNLAEYNTFGGSTGHVTYGANCINGTPCISMGSDTTVTTIALTKATVGDLSIVAGKSLFYGFLWTSITNLAFAANIHFGMYLTTNGTVPTHDIGTSNAYDPIDDPSVTLVDQMRCTASCGSAPETWTADLYSLRTLGHGDTIFSEDSGCHAGSHFMCGSDSFNPNGNALENDWFLNYTGVNTGTTCGTGNGAGCSFLNLVSSQVDSTQQSPWFAFQAQQYYLGFYVMPTLGNVIGYTFNTANGVNELQYFVSGPVAAVPPNIDTGGFFGPIIRALISIGVFIAQNLLNFAQFLYNVLAPLMAGLISSLSSVIVSILNAIGGLWGDSSLGTQMSGFVADFTNFLNSAFTNLVGLVGLIVTMINNITTFITNFFNTTNFTNLLFGATGFLGALVNMWTIINGVWGDIAKWFNAGSITAIAILEIDWAIGCLWTAFEEEGFTDWLDLNQLIVVRLFQIAYWLFELGLDVLFKIVMIVKGRVAPFQIAAEG